MNSPLLRIVLTGLVTVAIVVGGWLLIIRVSGPADAPDFATMSDPVARKECFFRWLAPIVAQENARVAQVRQRLLQLRDADPSGSTWSGREQRYVASLARRYKVPATQAEPEAMLAALLVRVDTIPARLALAQGAVESGWGTSRFAREANNYFGVWTWRHDGLVPEDRRAGENHAVAAYEDAAESVRVYLFTLDAGAAYEELRRLRADDRIAGRTPRAEVLAAGLRGYSERGDAYVAEIRQVLRVNATILDEVLEGT